MTMQTEIFTVASWEPRFSLGLKRIIETNSINQLNMLYEIEYESRTNEARANIKEYANSKGILINEIEISIDRPSKTWNTLYDVIVTKFMRPSNYIVDITTMPREVIWITIDLLLMKNKTLKYIYNRPESYNTDWLSRDPAKPRLVYKLAGEAKLGARTVLVIIAGYDVDRVKQLIRSFEPKSVLLGLQEGDQFKNVEKNIIPTENEFRKETDVRIFKLDAYKKDHGLDNILTIVKPLLKDYNIVMSSLGPKPSAIALYKIHQTYPTIGLAYAPSREFNPEYSYGLGESLEGSISS